MKAGTIASAVVALLLTVTSASAQGQLDKLKNTTPEQRAKAQTAMMKAKLDLTAEQLPKVEELNLTYAKRMEPIIKGSDGPLVKMRQAKEINGEKEAALKQLLTPDQFTKFLAAKEEMREQFEKKMEERAR